MELGPEDVSLLERCPHFRGWYVQSWDQSIREVSSFLISPCFSLSHLLHPSRHLLLTPCVLHFHLSPGSHLLVTISKPPIIHHHLWQTITVVTLQYMTAFSGRTDTHTERHTHTHTHTHRPNYRNPRWTCTSRVKNPFPPPISCSGF